MKRFFIRLFTFLLVSNVLFVLKATSQDGTLDVSFNQNGISYFSLGQSQYCSAISNALQNDGKIVVAARYTHNSKTDFMVLRYHGYGQLDTTFNHTGYSMLSLSSFNDYANSICVQQDGKIVLSGFTYAGGYNDMAVVRYNSDGSLDSTFDGDGIKIIPIASKTEYAFDCIQQPNGRLVLTGLCNYNGLGASDVCMIRLMPNGMIDSSFGVNGICGYDLQAGIDVGYAITLQPDGKLLVCGYSGDGSALNTAFIGRFQHNGIRDSSFNGNGVRLIPLGVSSKLYDIQIQSDLKLVAVGFSSLPDSTQVSTLVRLNTDGSNDSTFNHTGVLQYLSNSPSRGFSLRLQSDGKMITGGSQYNNQNWDITLARFLPDATPDSSFGNAGFTIQNLSNSKDEEIHAISLQPDNKIVVCGFSDTSLLVARYNNEAVGIETAELNSMKFYIYPNPAQHNLYLDLDEPLPNGNAIIYSILGNKIDFIPLSSGTHFKIDCSNYLPGIYLLTLTNKGSLISTGRSFIIR